LDPPVVGSFENGVGHFFGKDTFNGKPIIVMFRWDARDREHPKWSQAFTADDGETWEWNWYNVKERIAGPFQTTQMKSLPKITKAGAHPKSFPLSLAKLNFDSKGNLVIVPSPTSSNTDFDFFIGQWTLDHTRLKSRLSNSNEWEEFQNNVEDFRILEGAGNMDVVYSTVNGKPWEARTIRLFDPTTRLWSLYWVTSATGKMDPPVVGSFENGVGQFFGKDAFNGRKIIMVFNWDKRDKENPVWSQAFSADDGKTWEWNWTNVSHRIK
jgi:hypothetical protein